MKDLIKTRYSTLRKRISEALLSFPLLRRNKTLLAYWLLGARKAQIIVLLLLLTVPTVFTYAMDNTLSFVLRPVTKKIVFGLIDRKKENPLLPAAKVMGRILLWSGTTCTAVILFILNMPVAIVRANERSISCEQEADGLPHNDSVRKASLYLHAFHLATKTESIKRIEKKLLNLRSTAWVSQNTGSGTITADAATVILSGDHPVTCFIGAHDRYEILRSIGRGATGIVSVAHDSVLDRDVAVKELPSHFVHDQDLITRFRKEAKLLARLTHPHIVQVFDFLEDHGHAWIIMELVDGGELADLLKERSSLSLRESIALSTQIAGALLYAHDKGVVHRDIKPSNILMTKDGQPKITDFGIAKFAEDSAHFTQAGTILGSPAYMSPEQARGEQIDHRSDIYSFGIMLYRMITGKVPFEGDIQSVIAQHLNSTPPSPRQYVKSMPIKIEKLILAMLRKAPDERPRTMEDIINELGSLKRI